MENWKKELLEIDSLEGHLETLENISCAYISSVYADDNTCRVSACILLKKLKELLLFDEKNWE